MILLKELSKNFQLGQNVVPVLQNINLEIKQGEFIGLIGKSGSGKSTLLHLIAGLTKPSEGQVLIDNRSLNSLKDDEISVLRNQKIGLIFQDFHLFNHLNLEENIALPYLLKNKNSTNLAKLKEKTNQLLKEVDLQIRAQHKPTQISGGQKQRIAIARALINEPTILLADEPTGNLDSSTGKQIIKLIKKIHQEKKVTIIVATHDKEIASYADRIIEIENGKILKKPHTQKFTT